MSFEQWVGFARMCHMRAMRRQVRPYDAGLVSPCSPRPSPPLPSPSRGWTPLRCALSPRPCASQAGEKSLPSVRLSDTAKPDEMEVTYLQDVLTEFERFTRPLAPMTLTRAVSASAVSARGEHRSKL